MKVMDYGRQVEAAPCCSPRWTLEGTPLCGLTNHVSLDKRLDDTQPHFSTKTNAYNNSKDSYKDELNR